MIRDVLFFFGYLWAFPLSIAGVLLMNFGRTNLIDSRDVNLIYEALPGGLLSKFFDRFGVDAFTWGAVICLRAYPLINDAELVRHERRHTVHAMWFGPLLPLAYGLTSLWALCSGGRWYADNWFERDARRHARGAKN